MPELYEEDRIANAVCERLPLIALVSPDDELVAVVLRIAQSKSPVMPVLLKCDCPSLDPGTLVKPMMDNFEDSIVTNGKFAYHLAQVAESLRVVFVRYRFKSGDVLEIIGHSDITDEFPDFKPRPKPKPTAADPADPFAVIAEMRQHLRGGRRGSRPSREGGRRRRSHDAGIPDGEVPDIDRPDTDLPEDELDTDIAGDTADAPPPADMLDADPPPPLPPPADIVPDDDLDDTEIAEAMPEAAAPHVMYDVAKQQVWGLLYMPHIGAQLEHFMVSLQFAFGFRIKSITSSAVF